MISKLKSYLVKELKIKDLGKLRYFLIIEVAQSDMGIFISQRKYMLDVLKEIGMLTCRPAKMPMEAYHQLKEMMGKKLMWEDIRGLWEK